MGGKLDPNPIYIASGSKWFLRGIYGFFLLEKKDNEIICSFIDQNENILFFKTIY